MWDSLLNGMATYQTPERRQHFRSMGILFGISTHPTYLIRLFERVRLLPACRSSPARGLPSAPSSTHLARGHSLDAWFWFNAHSYVCQGIHRRLSATSNQLGSRLCRWSLCTGVLSQDKDMRYFLHLKCWEARLMRGFWAADVVWEVRNTATHNS